MAGSLTLLSLSGADLPALNAGLNTVCAILLVAAYVAVRRRQYRLHQQLMLSAFAVSVLFLASYLYYHFSVKDGTPTRFTAPGLPRLVYFTVLVTHTILAAAVAPMALVTLILGFNATRNGHKQIARYTLPIWLYVSVTGVVVYVMLYHLYPPA